ncbi:Ribosomal protein S6--L-glutamate ligase [compost metagenome]
MVPVIIQHAAVDACEVLGLDFGAVDVALGKDGKVYVFEVNTAPGIEGTCLEAYVNAFKEVM